MKNTHSIKLVILAAAAAIGLVSASFAQAPNVAVPNPADTRASGLLGQNYLSLSYDYTNFHRSSLTARSYGVEFNQALREGLDAFLGYGYSRSSAVLGSRLKGHDLFLGARSYLTHGSVKPFVELGAGWTWARGLASDDSFAWGAGVGAEFAVTSAFSVTPYVRYTDAVDFPGSGTWTYGAKTNYWVTPKVGLALGVSRDDDKHMAYTVGANFRF